MRSLDAGGPLQSILLAGIGGGAAIYLAGSSLPAGFQVLVWTGLANTALVTVGGLTLGIVLGLLQVGGLASRVRALRLLSTASIAAGRAVPLVCSLLLAYWVPPLLGLDVPALWCAVLAIGFVEAGYLAAILDGLRQVVASRYRDAAYMLGLPPADWRRRILLPQVLRLAMPHLTNFAVYTIKASSLAWFISVQDLTQVVRVISTATADPVGAYAILFATYLLAGAILTFAGQALEARLARSMPVEAAGFRDA